MGCRTGLALAAALMLMCCAAAQPTIDQADDGALQPNGRKVLGVIGPFQQKVLAAGAVGWATGGPSGAAMNMGGAVLGNHAKKRWGFGRKMLESDSTAGDYWVPQQRPQVIRVPGQGIKFNPAPGLQPPPGSRWIHPMYKYQKDLAPKLHY